MTLYAECALLQPYESFSAFIKLSCVRGRIKYQQALSGDCCIDFFFLTSRMHYDNAVIVSLYIYILRALWLWRIMRIFSILKRGRLIVYIAVLFSRARESNL